MVETRFEPLRLDEQTTVTIETIDLGGNVRSVPKSRISTK